MADGDTTWLPVEGSTLINISKADVGLGSVDNSSDELKPLSLAARTALAAKASSGDVAARADTALSNVVAETARSNLGLGSAALADASAFAPAAVPVIDDGGWLAAPDSTQDDGVWG